MSSAGETQPKDTQGKETSTVMSIEEAERSFVSKYNDFSKLELREPIERCKTIVLNHCSPLDEKYLIYELEVCIPPEIVKRNKVVENEPRRFYEASLALGEFFLFVLAYLMGQTNTTTKADMESRIREIKQKLQEAREESTKKDKAREEIDKEDAEKVHPSLFFDAIEAGLDLLSDPPKLPSWKVLEFIDKNLLRQKLLCHSRVFQVYLEVVATLFIVKRWRNDRSKPKSDEGLKEGEKLKQEIALSSLIRTIAVLYRGIPGYPSLLDVLARDSNGKDNDMVKEVMRWTRRQYGGATRRGNTEDQSGANEMTNGEEQFVAVVNMLTSLAVNEQWAKKIFDVLTEPSAVGVFSMKNFVVAISAHADIFRRELDADRNEYKIDTQEGLGLEAIMRLLSVLYKMGKVPEQAKGIEKKLAVLIASPVPCSLKACALELMGSMGIALWEYFEQRVSVSMIESRRGGILGDIETIERTEKKFFLPAAIAHFIQWQLENENVRSPKSFDIYHKFLCKYALVSLRQQWEFEHVEMKWATLKAICGAWIAGCDLKRHEVCFDTIFRSAVADDLVDGMVSELLLELADEGIPLDAILSVVTLLLILCKNEHTFIDRSQLSGKPCSPSLVNQLSKNSEALTKLLACIASPVVELQIKCIKLLKYLSVNSPLIVQCLLARQEACAIQIFEAVIDDDVTTGENGVSPRYELMRFLLKLGRNSFFLRHVAGFDLHDPPKSITQSKLTNGIFPKLVEKLCTKTTYRDSPQFAAAAFSVLLNICENQLTAIPLLKFLRGRFFTAVPLWETDVGTRVIGYFLQMVARDASYSQDGLSYVIPVFSELTKTVSVSDISTRAILLLDFIGRIENDEDSCEIAKGVKDIVIAYLNERRLVALMKREPDVYQRLWILIMTGLLERLPTITRNVTTVILADTLAIIGEMVISNKLFGDIDIAQSVRIYAKALESLAHLLEMDQSGSRNGIYSFMNSLVKSTKESPELVSVTQDFEQVILRAAQQDCVSELPVLRMTVLSFLETLVAYRCLTSSEYFLSFMTQRVSEISNDWQLCELDQQSGLMCLAAKCSFLTRFLTTSPDPAREGRFLLDEGVIYRLSRPSFWNGLKEAFTTTDKYYRSICKLETAGKIVRLVTTISFVFSISESLEIQLSRFLTDFSDSFAGVLEQGGLYENVVTCETARFLRDLSALLASIEQPNILKKTSEIWDKVPPLFRRFVEYEDWKRNLLSEPIEGVIEVEVASRLVDRMLYQLCFVLFHLSETEDVLAGSTFGQPRAVEKKDRKIPLTVATTYLKRLLQTEDRSLLPVVSALYFVIWRHVDRWQRCSGEIDLDQIKREVLDLTKVQFPFPLTSNEHIILKKLRQFAFE